MLKKEDNNPIRRQRPQNDSDAWAPPEEFRAVSLKAIRRPSGHDAVVVAPLAQGGRGPPYLARPRSTSLPNLKMKSVSDILCGSTK